MSYLVNKLYRTCMVSTIGTTL